MSEYTRDTLHMILLVLCRGSENRKQYDSIMDIIFPDMPNEQRNYYYESFSEAQGILNVLNLLGAKMHLSTEHPKPDDDLPDNVTPIR